MIGRITLTFAAIGFLLPLLLFVGALLGESWESESILYFWPTSVMLLPVASAGPWYEKLFAFIFSAALNAALYAFVGVLVALCWQVFGKTGRSTRVE